MKGWECEIRISCFYFKLQKILTSPTILYLWLYELDFNLIHLVLYKNGPA